MTHPTESALALHAGKELGLPARFRIGIHLRGCGVCRSRLAELRGVREWMRSQDGEMPEGVNWDALSSEMRANIRLGLSAGRCVEQETETVAAPGRFRWSAPAMALPVLLVVIAGWVLQTLHPPLAPAGPEFVMQASSTGIGIEKDGRGFTLLQPRAENVVFSVTGDAAGARYVDAETGQVTISNVYAQ